MKRKRGRWIGWAQKERRKEILRRQGLSFSQWCWDIVGRKQYRKERDALADRKNRNKEARDKLIHGSKPVAQVKQSWFGALKSKFMRRKV